MTDIERGLDLIRALCPDTSEISVASFPGDPKSKARPIFTRKGYVVTPSARDEDALAMQMRAAIRDRRRPYQLAVGAIFFRPNFQRIDVDNLLKHLFDSGTKAELWLDDSQITAAIGIVEYDKDNPRTIMAIGRHKTSFERPIVITTCPVCSREFENVQYESQRRKFCSRECRSSAAKRPSSTGSCASCGAKLSKPQYGLCRECWRG